MLYCFLSNTQKQYQLYRLQGYERRREFAMPHLKLDQSLVDEARALALHIVEPVINYIGEHTTVAIERTTLRLIGVDGIDEDDVPLPNRVVDSALPLLPGGILRPFVATMLKNNLGVQATAEAIGRGELALHEVGNEHQFLAAIEAEAARLVQEGIARIRARRAERTAMVEELG